MTEKKSNFYLLKDLLGPLLREWGHDTVRQCLAELHADHRNGSSSSATQERKSSKQHRRASASEIVERLDASTAQKELLREFAAKFDAKTFLPTASDVRYFLEMRGHAPSQIKQRQDSFGKVLNVLVGMADDELLLVLGSATHAGPTQLGPLSDAIKATSAIARGIELFAEPKGSESSTENQSTSTDDSGAKS